MANATAQLNNYRQSPRKVRVVASLVRGKSIPKAMTALEFAGKRAALPLQKLLMSAVANAKSAGLDADKLVVSKITVDGGQTLFRMLPMARGRGFRMRKRTSHVTIEVSEAAPKAEKKAKAPAKKAAKKEVNVETK